MMVSSQIVGEGWFFLHSFLFGIFLTWFYDWFRILRRVISHGIFWISMEDLIFWISASLGIFLMMYYENNGAFRWFSVFGSGAGMLFYKKTLSEWYVALISGLFRSILKFFGLVLRKLFAPIGRAGKKLQILWRRLIRKLKRKFRIWKRSKIYRLTGWYKAIKIKLSKHEESKPADLIHRSIKSRRK